MSTISVRVSDDELNLIQNYAKVNRISVSALFRDAVLDVIEEDFNLDEKRIIEARDRARNEKSYSFEEARRILGV